MEEEGERILLFRDLKVRTMETQKKLRREKQYGRNSVGGSRLLRRLNNNEFRQGKRGNDSNREVVRKGQWGMTGVRVGGS